MQNLKNKIFTSESVSEGHPDKVCDQISDAILDKCLEQDPESRVACECFAGRGFLVISGEITTNAVVDYDKVARDTIRRVGYTEHELGFSADTVAIMVMINKQSPDIALRTCKEVGGAGDQGIMFGYACNETKELMPAPIMFSHSIVKKLAELRKTPNSIESKLLKPDAKSQVSVEYGLDGKVKRIDTIVVSTQHSEQATQAEIEELIKTKVIADCIPENLIDKNTNILVNPSGRFVIGGPMGDTGLTGRKIVVDTYGGKGRTGGGALSSKDPTKVDRTAAYMARYLAKNIVAAGIADECEIELAYAIGKAEPVAVYCNTFNTGKVQESEIEQFIQDNFDLTPYGMIKFLDLQKPQYEKLAAYGHMGREDLGVKWEDTSESNTFRRLIKHEDLADSTLL